MTLIDALKVLFKPSTKKYSLSDEDRERALIIRNEKHKNQILTLEAERKIIELKAKKAELDFKEEYGSDNNMTEIIMPVMEILKSMKTAQPSTTPVLNNGKTAVFNPTEEDIREFIKVQPKEYIKLAKKRPKSEVLAGVMMKFKLNEEQANKAYDILMTEF